MPIQTSILDHDVLGPLFQKGNRKGGYRGVEGRQEGELAILRPLIEKRSGNLPGGIPRSSRAYGRRSWKI